jgi:hypothetical protein
MEFRFKKLRLIFVDQILEFLVSLRIAAYDIGRGSWKRGGKVEEVVCRVSTKSSKSFRFVGANLMDDTPGRRFYIGVFRMNGQRSASVELWYQTTGNDTIMTRCELT